MPPRRAPSGQGPAGRPRRERGPARSAAPREHEPRAERPATTLISLRTGTDATRSATRPASARRAAPAGAAKRTAAPATGRLSGRATALGLVLLALMLAYAYPVRLYLDQQAEIQRLVSTQAEQRAEIGKLSDESAKWSDPAYIRAQARARFQMVDPGTKAYLVLPPTTTSTDTGGIGSTAGSPWYGTLWSSLRAADHPGRR